MDEKDVLTLLNGFEKRMKFINIMQCFVRNTFPEHIRKMINGNSQILANIIIAVMVFIEEKTLGVHQSCSMSDISEFIDELSKLFPQEYHIEPEPMARYIVIEVLQNGGRPINYETYNSEKNTFSSMNIRLLDEDKGKYFLTNDAFDFMFRTKEIESELDYSVTRFRMNEYMKRDNYTQAMGESRELIRRIRNMSNDMDSFIRMCRENISRISEDRYEEILKRTSDLLDEEYRQLIDIQESAELRKNNMQTAVESGLGTEQLEPQYKALCEIIENIQITIEEQRGLINKKQSVSSTYESIIEDSFIIENFEKVDFEKDILKPIRQGKYNIAKYSNMLMNIFTVPKLKKYFSIENFYMPQSRFVENESEAGIDITEDAEEIPDVTEIRNQRNLRIVTLFFEYAKEHSIFTAKEFVESLSQDEINKLCEENTLPGVLVSLYAMQELDIASWRKTERIAIIPNGEFELSWYLNEMDENIVQMNRIKFLFEDGEFTFSFFNNRYTSNVTMNNYRIEVE